MKEFNAFIKDANLMDLEMKNDNFTWFGPQGKCSKLDRLLVNSNWLESGSWSIVSLCRLASDHKQYTSGVIMYLGDQNHSKDLIDGCKKTLLIKSWSCFGKKEI